MSTTARERRPSWADGLAAEYPFEPHYFDQRGVAQHYVDVGPRGAEPLVFVHGNPTWSFLWRAPLRELSVARRCIAIDHVGCGLSDKPREYDYTLARHVDNLERLIDGLALERVSLVLHDWGGPIGLGFAVRHPQRVARLVLANTGCFAGWSAPWRIRVCRTPLLGLLAVRGLNAFARAATHMAVSRPLREPARRGLLAPYDSFDHRIATLEFVRDIPLGPRDRSWPTLVEIERALPCLAPKPTCLIWGERDFCFTPAFREEWQRRFPSARVHRLAAGHYVTEDAPGEFVHALSRFLDDHPVRP